MSSPSQSVSRISIQILINNEDVIEAELVRHLSPLTIRKIVNSLPLNGIIHRFADSFVYLQTDIMTGSEKSQSQFKTGEIAFAPANGFLCIFLRDSKIAQRFNPLGKINSNQIQRFNFTKVGDQISIKMIS